MKSLLDIVNESLQIRVNEAFNSAILSSIINNKYSKTVWEIYHSSASRFNKLLFDRITDDEIEQFDASKYKQLSKSIKTGKEFDKCLILWIDKSNTLRAISAGTRLWCKFNARLGKRGRYEYGSVSALKRYLKEDILHAYVITSTENQLATELIDNRWNSKIDAMSFQSNAAILKRNIKRYEAAKVTLKARSAFSEFQSNLTNAKLAIDDMITELRELQSALQFTSKWSVISKLTNLLKQSVDAYVNASNELQEIERLASRDTQDNTLSASDTFSVTHFKTYLGQIEILKRDFYDLYEELNS